MHLILLLSTSITFESVLPIMSKIKYVVNSLFFMCWYKYYYDEFQIVSCMFVPFFKIC